jgi:hypothetical protein
MKGSYYDVRCETRKAEQNQNLNKINALGIDKIKTRNTETELKKKLV